MIKHILLACGCMAAVSGFAEMEPLSLDRALTLAREHSPELRAARMQTSAAEQAVAAAGVWRNPELEFEAERVGGDYDGFNDSQYTIGIAQTFERGGKRKNDRRVAEQSIAVAFQAEGEKAMTLMAEVRLAFIEVLSQQEIGTVRSEQEQLGRAFVEVAKRRLDAGGGSELEVTEAELALEEILLSQTCCFGDLKAARIHLASLIGLTEHEMPELTGDYYELPALEETVIAESHPALQRIQAQIAVKKAQAERAKSKDAADLTLGAGYRYDAASDDNSFVLGASMPLNFFRPGRAEQAATLLQADALQAEYDERRRFLQQQLSMLIAVYSGAKLEAEMTRNNLMPKAEKAYALSQTGYEAGRFSWLELINAQQHLAAIRVRHIEALRAAHKARAEVSKFMKEGS